MLVLDEEHYAPNTVEKSEKYPFGAAKDCSEPGRPDGTPILAAMVNDVYGARQALFKDAFGEGAEITGNPDDASDSDVLRAIKRLDQNVADEAEEKLEVERHARKDADDAEKTARETAVSDEATARANADSAEAIARGNADSTLDGKKNDKIKVSDSTTAIGDSDTFVTSGIANNKDNPTSLARKTFTMVWTWIKGKLDAGLTITKKWTFSGGIKGDVEGNASTATKLETVRWLIVKDNKGRHSMQTASFDGSEDVTLKLPETIEATLEGNATSADKVNKSLKFGTKSYDGSAEKTITAADLGALTAHQDISGKADKNNNHDDAYAAKNHTHEASSTIKYNDERKSSVNFVVSGSELCIKF